jgi:Rrf2 family nitric oxide-sensitive transcriptional repressor
MRLTLYTDYTLRVMMYLAVKSRDGATTTIDEIADAYAISRSNLTKIVNELAQNGLIETIRGRAGGMRLAQPPGEISVGALVRLAEKDFGIVACHSMTADVNCAILPTCNLRNGLKRAVDAFLRELDKMTLADAIISPSVAASLLQIGPVRGKEVAVSVTSLVGRHHTSGKSKGHAAQARRKPRRSRISKAI